MSNRLLWVGSEKDFVDEKDVQSVDRVTVGRLVGIHQLGSIRTRMAALFGEDRIGNSPRF